MTVEPKLSIIFLREDNNNHNITINSLENQSFKNFEILYLNNENIETKVDYIKIFNKDSFENIINKCNGEYVLFLKSGDYLLTDSLNVLLNNISNNDLDFICFNSNNYSKEDKINKNFFEKKLKEKWSVERQKVVNCDSEDFKKYIFSNLNNLYNKLFSRKFLIYNFEKIFDNDNVFDFVFDIKISVLSKNVFSVEDTLLFHKALNIHENFKLINDHMISADCSSLEVVDAIEGIENYLLRRNLLEKYENEFIKFKLKILTDNLDMSKFHDYILHVPKNERKNFRNKYFDYSKYYNSNSIYVGFQEEYSNLLFNKTKEFLLKQVIFKNEVKNILEEDADFALIFEKYESILNSDNFNEYIALSSASTINRLKQENKLLKIESDYLNKNLELYDTLINENLKIKDESKKLISKRKLNIEYEDYINSKISSSNKK